MLEVAIEATTQLLELQQLLVQLQLQQQQPRGQVISFLKIDFNYWKIFRVLWSQVCKYM